MKKNYNVSIFIQNYFAHFGCSLALRSNLPHEKMFALIDHAALPFYCWNQTCTSPFEYKTDRSTIQCMNRHTHTHTLFIWQQSLNYLLLNLKARNRK